MPVAVDGVPDEILDPRSTWSDPAAYDERAAALAKMFVENFEKFAADAGPDVTSAGPKLDASA